jgi:hypothetical protein
MPSFSVATWENFSNVSGGNVFAADGMSIASCGGVFEGWFLSYGAFNYCNGSNINTNLSFSSPSLNSWHHFVATFTSNGSANIFIDGNIATTVAVGTITYGSPPTNIEIGSQSNRGNGPTGFLDDVRVYNRALSTAEVQALYNAER